MDGVGQAVIGGVITERDGQAVIGLRITFCRTRWA